jgi:hypothetical protein
VSAELRGLLAQRGIPSLAEAVGLGHTMQQRHVAAQRARAEQVRATVDGAAR